MVAADSVVCKGIFAGIIDKGDAVAVVADSVVGNGIFARNIEEADAAAVAVVGGVVCNGVIAGEG